MGGGEFAAAQSETEIRFDLRECRYHSFGGTYESVSPSGIRVQMVDINGRIPVGCPRRQLKVRLSSGHPRRRRDTKYFASDARRHTSAPEITFPSSARHDIVTKTNKDVDYRTRFKILYAACTFYVARKLSDFITDRKTHGRRIFPTIRYRYNNDYTKILVFFFLFRSSFVSPNVYDTYTRPCAYGTRPVVVIIFSYAVKRPSTKR